MNTDTTHRTPGQLIEELLEVKGWTQRVLAVVLKMDESTLNKIITGKRALDAEMALALSELFEMPAERFLELQKSYELAQARILSRGDPDRNNRARIFGSLPVSEMIKRGWLDADDIRNFPRVEAAIAKFFGASNVDEIDIFPHSAKKTNIFDKATPIQLAWLYRVKEIASEMLTARYSPSAVRNAIPKLQGLLCSVEAVRKVPRILAECGVRYVIVEPLHGSKIDGVCFWLDDNKPVIGMSLRHDRIDNFWFVLRHELEHVIQLHGRNAMMLDVELEEGSTECGADVVEEERIANQAAAEFCVPQKSLKSFIARKAPYYNEQDVIGFARTLQVHPGLVAGQLRSKLKLWKRFHNHLVKIRSIVARDGTTVDGWGNVVPVG